jgi:Protein of unknown function (DUF1524)
VGRAIPVLVLIVAVGVAVAAWLHFRAETIVAVPPGAPPSQGSIGYEQVRADLQRLPVKGWDRRRDFTRNRFGEAWSDDVDVELGRNGCNTRDDVLARDLTDVAMRPGTCFVQRGTLHDPYRGETIAFVRGPATSDTVQIDHVVSLADAWYKGACDWDDERRRDFANDPRNLLAVSAKGNFDKAFRDAASWLPPNVGFRCEFVARQVEVKTDYGLWVSDKEERAMAEVLAGC